MSEVTKFRSPTCDAEYLARLIRERAHERLASVV